MIGNRFIGRIGRRPAAPCHRRGLNRSPPRPRERGFVGESANYLRRAISGFITVGDRATLSRTRATTRTSTNRSRALRDATNPACSRSHFRELSTTLDSMRLYDGYPPAMYCSRCSIVAVCAEINHLSASPIDRMPISFPFSKTGR